MNARSITIPRLLHVAPDCLSGVAPLLADHDFDTTKVCIGSGGHASASFAGRVIDGLLAADINIVQASRLGGTLEQAAKTAAVIIEERVSLVVGVGGGRVIDTMKLAAARTGTDFISVPTTIAHDGISSPVASLTERDGRRTTHAAMMPAGVIVDVRVIGSAPPRTLRSGIGDLVSNLTALLDWRLADQLGKDHYDAFSAMIAESAARPILDVLDIDLIETHERLANGLLLSGLAMAASGTSRPCSGAEHLVSHSLDRLLGPDAAMHGEQVALGCLISAAAHGSPLLSDLQDLFTRVNIPTAPADLGMTEAQMVEAVLAAPATRPERYTILSEISGRPAVTSLVETAFGSSRVRT
jgi:glycerol-1-phosphate dehydrogenase [NAD(P)+]